MKYTAVAILLAVLFLLSALSIRAKTITPDEGAHFIYGYNLLYLEPDKLSDSQMPFSALNAIPTRLVHFNKRVDIIRADIPAYIEVLRGRVVTILFSLLLAFYVFKWSGELYGVKAGLLSLALCVFSPSIIAHARLVTNDVYAAGMILISTYYFWRVFQYPGWAGALRSAFLLGLSQLAKYSCLLLFPLYAMLACVRFVAGLAGCRKGQRKGYAGKAFKMGLCYGLVFVFVTLVVLNAGFLFNGSLMTLGQYEFDSVFFNAVQHKLGAFKDVPLFLPKPFVVGLDWLKLFLEGKGNAGNGYMLGRLVEMDTPALNMNGYYLVCFLFKVPLATQIIFWAALFNYVARREKYRFFSDELFVLLPLFFFFLYFELLVPAHLGIRYILPVLPFLFVFCGSLLKDWDHFPNKARWAVRAGVAWLVFSVLSYFPHYISYFNEFVPDRKMAYKVLADSNLDWDQNRFYLKKYVRAHPGVIVAPERPVSGRIIVNANDLVGVVEKERYRWLRENFTPTDHIAYSYLIFDVTPQELERVTVSLDGLESLRALPYASWSTEKADTQKNGVTLHNKNLAVDGYNLYTNNENIVYLMDMKGNILHQWTVPDDGRCEYAELVNGKDLYVVCVNHAVYKLDLNSKMRMRISSRAHHDIHVLEDSTVMFPAQDKLRQYEGRRGFFDTIYRVTQTIKPVEIWSTYSRLDEIRKLHKPSLLDSPAEDQSTGQRKVYDYYHLNTIETLPENLLGKTDRRFQKGNWLVCLRNANLIIILDKDSKRIVWSWGTDTLDYPHMPTMTENGNILVFDNGLHRGYSTVLELNPATGQVVWKYEGKPKESFYSDYYGAVQRFANGNTLITESAKGRAFEITQRGRLVWEYWNPEIKDGSRKTIYRMQRYTKEEAEPVLRFKAQ